MTADLAVYVDITTDQAIRDTLPSLGLLIRSEWESINPLISINKQVTYSCLLVYTFHTYDVGS